MDAKRAAAEQGMLLACGVAAHSLTLEASLTRCDIQPYPVPFEPPFAPLDPLQTFTHARQPMLAAAMPEEFSIRRWMLPAGDMHADAAATVLAGLAGCKGTLGLEVYIRRGQASFFLIAPPNEIDFYARAMLAMHPGSAMHPVTDPLTQLHRVGGLVDLYSPAPYHRAIKSPGSFCPHLFGLAAHLGADDLLVLQCLFRATRAPWQQKIGAILQTERSLGHRAPHGQSNDTKRVSEPLFASVIRIVSTTPTAQHGLQTLAGLFTADGQALRSRTYHDFLAALGPARTLGMLRGRASHTVGQLLDAHELAFFVHAPDRVAANMIDLTLLTGLPVPKRLQQPGIPLGTNRSTGVPIPVFQPCHQGNRSSWWPGMSRMGKSSALLHRIRHLAELREGVCLLDAHRELALAAPAYLGLDASRVMLLDFEAAMPVAFNPFANVDPEDFGSVALDITHTLKALFDADGYARMQHFLRMAVYGLLVLGANLGTLPELFTPEGEALRREIIARGPHERVRAFFEEEVPRLKPTTFAPITNRFSGFLLDDKTRQIFTQREHRADVTAAMHDGRVVLIAPPRTYESRAIVGGIIIALLQHAAFRRVGTPRAASHVSLLIDEFQNFLTSTRALQTIINEAAKGGLSVTLLHQETGQLPTELLKALYSIPNILVFGINAPDARQLAHVFNGAVSPETLSSQGVGDVHARIGHDIVTFTCPPPLREPDQDLAARIIAHSRAAYHAQSASVERPLKRAKRIIETC